MEIASQIGRTEGHAQRDNGACDDENSTPTYIYKIVIQINTKQIVCLLARSTERSSLGKKRRTKLIKERIGLNWKPIVTFRNHIHKLPQYYFIDTNAGNGFG